MPAFVADMLAPLAIVAVAYTVLGITGFGSALIAVPLLAWKWPLPEVVAITLMLDAPTAALHGGLNTRDVERGDLKRLLPGMLIGSVAGWWLSTVLDARWPLLLLGCYVILIGVDALRRVKATPAPVSTAWAGPVGVAIGVVEMMFGTAGPVVMAWLRRRLPDVRALRATAPVVMLLATVAVLINMAAVGRLSDASLWLRWLVLLALALPAVVLGNRLARRIPAASLRRVIFVLLILSGAMLCWRALR